MSAAKAWPVNADTARRAKKEVVFGRMWLALSFGPDEDVQKPWPRRPADASMCAAMSGGLSSHRPPRNRASPFARMFVMSLEPDNFGGPFQLDVLHLLSISRSLFRVELNIDAATCHSEGGT